MGKEKKKVEREDPNFVKAPKSFIFKIGRVLPSVKKLRDDLRQVMKPYTALHLQEGKKNELKDYLTIAGLYGVSHFILLSETDFGTYLRIAKVAQGPTLTFRITKYTLCNDLIENTKSFPPPPKTFDQPPLVVLGHFPSDSEHLKLTSVMIQNMFPSINVKEIDPKDCTRVVVFSYDKESNSIEFRHYQIQLSIIGINKNLKKILKKKIVHLGKYEDISDYVLGTNYGSDSEIEDSEENRVSVNSANNESQIQQAVRLIEIGPRMNLSLVKIEEGFCTGKVLYHQFVKKTKEEIQQLEQRKNKEKALKLKRKRAQEKNVERKGGKQSSHRNEDEYEDDDEEWFRKEVGSNEELRSEKKNKK